MPACLHFFPFIALSSSRSFFFPPILQPLIACTFRPIHPSPLPCNHYHAGLGRGRGARVCVGGASILCGAPRLLYGVRCLHGEEGWPVTLVAGLLGRLTKEGRRIIWYHGLQQNEKAVERKVGDVRKRPWNETLTKTTPLRACRRVLAVLAYRASCVLAC